MKTNVKFRAITSVFAAVILVIGSFFVAFLILGYLQPMYPEVHWHIQGKVSDESKTALSDASVHALGHGRVTAINHMFSLPPRRVSVFAKTDRQGNFTLDFWSSDFRLDIERVGFETSRSIYLAADGEKATNVTATIKLDRSTQP